MTVVQNNSSVVFQVVAYSGGYYSNTKLTIMSIIN